MNTIHIFDNKDYEGTWDVLSREAVRAVIFLQNKIALVKSEVKGFYKFPGGGIHKHENHTDALIRETLEETGLNILPLTVTPIGMIQEIRKGLRDNEIFSHKSYYYFAETDNTTSMQNLDSYEKDLGFTLEWVELQYAYSTNIALAKDDELYFLEREIYMLKHLMNMRNPNNK